MLLKCLQLSEGAKRLLKRLLCPDPEKRASADEALQDPWCLKDLPSGSLELNEELMRRHEIRTVEEEERARQVDALVDAAELECVGQPEAVLTVHLTSFA